MRRRIGLIAALILCALNPGPAAADRFDPFDVVDVVVKPGVRIPTDAAFRDETGRRVRLGEYFGGGQPVLLAPVYFTCPNICGVTVANLFQALETVPFTPGEDFQVVALSIDPRETPKEASATKAEVLERYDLGGGAGLHFLTGGREAIRRVTDTLGFRYSWDPELQQYAHPAALAVLTPDAELARWIFGIDYQPSDLRLAFTEAADGAIGSLTDKILLLCYSYDPETGQYNGLIWGLLRAGGALTLLGLGGFAGYSILRERRGQKRGDASG